MTIPRMPTQPLFSESPAQIKNIEVSALKTRLSGSSEMDVVVARFNDDNQLSIRKLNTGIALHSLEENPLEIASVLPMPRTSAFTARAAMR